MPPPIVMVATGDPSVVTSKNKGRSVGAQLVMYCVMIVSKVVMKCCIRCYLYGTTAELEWLCKIIGITDLGATF